MCSAGRSDRDVDVERLPPQITRPDRRRHRPLTNRWGAGDRRISWPPVSLDRPAGQAPAPYGATPPARHPSPPQHSGGSTTSPNNARNRVHGRQQHRNDYAERANRTAIRGRAPHDRRCRLVMLTRQAASYSSTQVSRLGSWGARRRAGWASTAPWVASAGRACGPAWTPQDTPPGRRDR